MCAPRMQRAPLFHFHRCSLRACTFSNDRVPRHPNEIRKRSGINAGHRGATKSLCSRATDCASGLDALAWEINLSVCAGNVGINKRLYEVSKQASCSGCSQRAKRVCTLVYARRSARAASGTLTRMHTLPFELYNACDRVRERFYINWMSIESCLNSSRFVDWNTLKAEGRKK